ncbi:MAG: ferrous iron transport protein A [Clostridia bacterium]|nr:ferrous iron transport protein A [Clostridia bacterium]
MIPITFANTGEDCIIKRIGGNDEIKRHLASLGFTVGGHVTVVSSLSGNVIVNIKESRVAIGKDMAAKIMI